MRIKLAGILVLVVVGILAFYLGRLTANNQPVSSSEVVGQEITELQEDVKQLKDQAEQNARFQQRVCALRDNENLPEQLRPLFDACND